MAVEESLARARSRSGFRCETVAAALALTAVAVLSVIALVDPGLADRFTAEPGVVEWLQVLLDAAAALLFGRHLFRNASASGRLSPLDVVIVASLIGLVIGEVDLDRLVFGTKVIATRFFVDARVALPWRLITVVVVVGVPAAIGIFAHTRIRRFWQEGCRRPALGTRSRGERGDQRLDRGLRAPARPDAGRAALLSRGAVRAGGRDRLRRGRRRPPPRPDWLLRATSPSRTTATSRLPIV